MNNEYVVETNEKESLCQLKFGNYLKAQVTSLMLLLALLVLGQPFLISLSNLLHLLPLPTKHNKFSKITNIEISKN